MDAIFFALQELLSINHLFYLSLGVAIGMTVGFLPGLGGIAGLSLILPFLYDMEPSIALAMMIALTSTTSCSDVFPSILIGVPGTSGSQATVIDGFQLAKRGEGTRALSAAFSASLFGGCFGALVLTGAIFAARPLILMIGFGEQLMLILLALSMVGLLTGAAPIKGIVAGGLGLLIGVIGEAPATAELRMSLGTMYLGDGIPLVIVGLGMFAVPEIMEVLAQRETISETGKLGKGWLQGFKDTIKNRWLVLRCASLGCLIGALPGLGGSVIDWLAYGHALQTTPDRENFGKGDIRGVLAPESANNAKEGGALIPTLLFGIPGSGSMAILLGGLVLIGVEPGANMVGKDIHLSFICIWSIAIANIMGAGICFFLAKPAAKLTTVRFTLVAPVMIVLIFFAAFQANRDWGDLLALFILGTLGIFMKRFAWPRPALLIGFVLSDKLEAIVYQTIQVYGLVFLKRPLVIFLLIATIISIYTALRVKPNRPDLSESGPHTPANRSPQLIFWGILLAFCLWVILDATTRMFLGSIYPLIIGSLTLLLLLGTGKVLLFQKNPHACFYDAESKPAAQESPGKGELYYLFLVVLMLFGVALVGFQLASIGFVFLFYKAKAGASYWWSTVAALSIMVVLTMLSYYLVLVYPPGILQLLMDMPWPFN